MAQRRSEANVSDMYCVFCGNRGLSVARRNSKFREPGHLKKLYCIYCKKECNHAEVRGFFSEYNYEDFLLEREYDNFDEEGNRKEPYKTFKANLIKEGKIDG